MGIEGIIRPPPEIRAVTHKTALFVSKNGRAFEARIFNSAKGKTPKFAFLHETSPFHRYYEERILFYQNGGTDEDDAVVDAVTIKKEEKNEVEKTDADGGAADGVNGAFTNGDKASYGSADGAQKDGRDNANGQLAVSKDATGSTDTDTDKGKGKKDDTGAKVEIEKRKPSSSRKAKSIIDPVARALLVQRALVLASDKPADVPNDDDKVTTDSTNVTDKPSQSTLPPPPIEPIYTTTLPPKSISPVQLEIITTTAQFVALDGKGGTFLRDLTLREWNDPRTFGFLQPRHGDFAYFSALVDLYTRILAKCVYAKETHGGGIGGGTKNGVGLLTVMAIKNMVGLEPSPTANDTNTNTNTNTPQPPSTTFESSIAHEHAFLQSTATNIPNCLSAVAYRVEHRRHRQQQRRAALQRTQEEGGSSSWGGTSRIDWHDFVVVETIGFALDEVVEMLPPPPPPPPPVPLVKEVNTPMEVGGGDDMEGSSSEDEEDDADRETIDVVDDYNPTVVSSRSKLDSPSHTHVIDPITKQSIRVADTTEHMRIQLLDPKWAAEKRRFMDKQKDSNYVEGETIARNVDAFARARGGVGEGLFGSSKEELLGRVEDWKRRLEEAKRVIREQQLAQQMPMPRPIAGIGGGNGNHTTVIMGVNPQHIPQTILNHQQTIIHATATTAAAQQTLQTETMPHHTKPDLSIPNAKKPRTLESSVSSQLQPSSTSYVDLSTTTTDLTTTISQIPMAPPVPTTTLTAPSGIPTPTTQPPKDGTPTDPNAEPTGPTTLSETDFARSLPDTTVTLSVLIPPSNDATTKGWKFNEQTLSVAVDVMTTIKGVKKRLRSELGGMPMNKMQLKSSTLGFLRDGATLAFLNIGGSAGTGPGTALELVRKVRGGSGR